MPISKTRYRPGRFAVPGEDWRFGRVRRSQNPALSPRLEPGPSLSRLRFPGRPWDTYHGYPRTLRQPLPSPRPGPPAAAPARPSRRLAAKAAFSLLPALLYPLFFRWASLVYPRLGLTGKVLRPPTPTRFFPEMLIVILAAGSVVAIQTVFALVFFRRGKWAGRRPAIRWGEASVAGGLLAAGVYGVLRGFQYRADDFFFLPSFALGAAAFFWLLVAATALFGPRKREAPDTPGPIRTADTRFRKPVLYPSELQGRNIFAAQKY